MQVELFFEARAELGEGPAWEAQDRVLYWVDILGKRVFAGKELVLQADDYIGCLAPRAQGGLIVAVGRRLADIDAKGAQLGVRAEVSEPARNRFNDGKCDPAGRLLAGTMDMNEQEASGSLYSLSGHAVTKLLSGIRISNGLTWSPDYRTLYYIDTPSRQIQAFDYDLSTGNISNRRVAIEVPEALGWPDGMTSDTDGNLWVVLWHGAGVATWDPGTGALLEQIHVPALHTTSCVFGGRDLNELYITSARTGLNEAELKRYPLSGAVFKVDTRVRGLPTFEFCG